MRSVIERQRRGDSLQGILSEYLQNYELWKWYVAEDQTSFEPTIEQLWIFFLLQEGSIYFHNDTTNGFFPYTNAALNSLIFIVSRRRVGQHEISLSEAKAKASRRVNSLNQLYKLDLRWQGEISQIKRRVEEHISDWHSFHQSRLFTPIDTAEIKKDIADWRDRTYSKKRGCSPYSLLLIGYLKYFLSDDNESTEMYLQYQNPNKRPVVM